jgi:hypothetical protein
MGVRDQKSPGADFPVTIGFLVPRLSDQAS